jgi:hypothetical protein
MPFPTGKVLWKYSLTLFGNHLKTLGGCRRHPHGHRVEMYRRLPYITTISVTDRGPLGFSPTSLFNPTTSGFLKGGIGPWSKKHRVKRTFKTPRKRKRSRNPCLSAPQRPLPSTPGRRATMSPVRTAGQAPESDCALIFSLPSLAGSSKEKGPQYRPHDTRNSAFNLFSPGDIPPEGGNRSKRERAIRTPSKTLP